MVAACKDIDLDTPILDREPKSQQQSPSRSINGAKYSRKRTPEEPINRPKKKKKTTKGEVADTPSATLTDQPPPAKDHSGLFMVDTNPSDVKDLLRSFEAMSERPPAKKRKHSGPETLPVPSTVVQSSPETAQPSKKRIKVEHADGIQEDTSKEAPHHTAFEAKVELRLREKEDLRKKRADKKRKRNSEVSVVESSQVKSEDTTNEQQLPITSGLPKKARKRQRKAAEEEKKAETAKADEISPRSNGQENKTDHATPANGNTVKQLEEHGKKKLRKRKQTYDPTRPEAVTNSNIFDAHDPSRTPISKQEFKMQTLLTQYYQTLRQRGPVVEVAVSDDVELAVTDEKVLSDPASEGATGTKQNTETVADLKHACLGDREISKRRHTRVDI
ncbi:hypothetical protein LTR64_003663 [Lithohypha guttulata]|uniref:uncharacterized protein n=1 Tax=Lithohypha guttulata TaxID=1690604 RepID=UPI002DE19453|nr:hypothetical protein LTR51_000116 [Lithohypha guttulata]